MTREEIFNYVINEFGTQPEYLWKKYPSYAFSRHQSNRKWYGIVMTVERKNLGLDQSGSEDVMDIKMAPDQIDILQTMKGFLPAYHMNKGHWLSGRSISDSDSSVD
ncbi:MmcQ/YjbR family DNA-binding protein [Lentilactobacillus parafarraginis]|uniref:MmcQ/YjbR family DNA-binding protein n=1 Tax=Lentilactobacillus parafarraginis TaxID=390842 RepID=UPI001CDD2100|nr:MmcQ/YjbR family DNA-binding protein [Lentilactobacillus parafarraginis]